MTLLAKKNTLRLLTILGLLFLTQSITAQSAQKKEKIITDAVEAKTTFIENDGLLKPLFENAFAYVIFPNIGKGGIGVGAAAGNDAVDEHGTLIGMAKVKQVTVGLQ